MNSKQAGIYNITSKVNGRRYIGSAVRFNKRWIQHLHYLRANKHHSPQLQRHFNKYGEQDLVFSILEVIDRGELSLQDFRELLLSREQAYLDNWNECQFNCLPTAGSNLGYKRNGAKNYVFDKKINKYVTYYNILGKQVKFSQHQNEDEAVKEVEYMRTLTDEQLLNYKQECLTKPKRRKKTAKYYYFINNKWEVRFEIDGKVKLFGSFLNEEEAINKVKQVKLELGYE